MHSPRLLLAACLLLPSVGCTWMRDQIGIGKPPPPRGSGPIQNVTADQLVGYLNAQAGRLQSIEYRDVTVTGRAGDGIRGAVSEVVIPTLHGNLSASQPRQFRMAAAGGASGMKIDMGSNPDHFWAYIAPPTMQPMYVFASHRDFEDGRAQLPGNMPFDPDWVMQALGMTTFESKDLSQKDIDYQAKIDLRTYVLGWSTKTPTGMPIRKEIVFSADDARDPYPQVKKHLIKDAKGKVICFAEIRSARTVSVGGTDPQTGRPLEVKYPTEVFLRWEEQKFEMTLKLDHTHARVNQPLSPEETDRLFRLPNNLGIPPVNLAEARFNASGR